MTPSPRALAFQAAGLILVTFLVSTLSDETFAVTQSLLLVVGAVLLLAVALAVVLRPLRLAIFRLYGVAYPEHGPATADGEEMRGLLGPVMTAVACLVVSGVASLIR